MDLLEHHKRQEYCSTRLKYREGKQLKAVKVYTIANESCNLLIFGVPKVNLQQEVKHKFQRFGTLRFIKCLTNELSPLMKLELFTDVFHVKYASIESARRAKRYMDAQQFYGGILHISYAPEHETPDELRQKMARRREDVKNRLLANSKHKPPAPSTQRPD